MHQARRLRRYVDGEGFWNLQAKGTPQAGAAFNAVLDAIADEVFRAARRDGRHEEPEAYAFDALMSLADRAAGTAAAASAVAESSGGSPPGPSQRCPSERYLALLRVDVEALRRGRAEASELCELRGVGRVPVDVAREMLGEAVVKLVITRGVDVLNVTHLGRGPTAAQRVALAWTSPGCSVEGCYRTRTELDHREPWARTRHTRLDQLDPLCHYHHDLKTRHGWAQRPLAPVGEGMALAGWIPLGACSTFA